MRACLHGRTQAYTLAHMHDNACMRMRSRRHTRAGREDKSFKIRRPEPDDLMYRAAETLGLTPRRSHSSVSHRVSRPLASPLALALPDSLSLSLAPRLAVSCAAAQRADRAPRSRRLLGGKIKCAPSTPCGLEPGKAPRAAGRAPTLRVGVGGPRPQTVLSTRGGVGERALRQPPLQGPAQSAVPLSPAPECLTSKP